MSITCQELAAQIQRLQPDAMPHDVALLCLLLTNFVDDIQELKDEGRLSEAWREMGIRLQAAADQHAAMTKELEDLADSEPSGLTMGQMPILLRAIKTQNQILRLYAGVPPVGV